MKDAVAAKVALMPIHAVPGRTIRLPRPKRRDHVLDAARAIRLAHEGPPHR